MITILSSDFLQFPDVEMADANGLLAIGGNLEPHSLIRAYQSGIFPWYSEGEPICWYAPPERCVIIPNQIKVSKSMQTLIRKGIYSITKNKAFAQVMHHCANIERADQDGTWILPEMQKAYLKLHEFGKAHSIEVWQNETLIGGLYGVHQGNIFCGESMFSFAANASKMALIHLCKNEGYQLIDCQVPNDHLFSMGAVCISRDAFMKVLIQSNDNNNF